MIMRIDDAMQTAVQSRAEPEELRRAIEDIVDYVCIQAERRLVNWRRCPAVEFGGKSWWLKGTQVKLSRSLNCLEGGSSRHTFCLDHGVPEALADEVMNFLLRSCESDRTLLTDVAGFPQRLVERLQHCSVTTAEASLGWHSTLIIGDVAMALKIDRETLEQALRGARAAVNAEFLQELDRPQPDFPTGAELSERQPGNENQVNAPRDSSPADPWEL
jgi:hypothetical protein